MKKNTINIEFVNDLDKCCELFHEVPNKLKPAWFALILTYFDSYLKETPKVVADLILLIEDEKSWNKARNQAYEIAKYRMSNNNQNLDSYLLFAEKIAYLTDDILCNNINFDNNLSLELVQLANKAGQNCTENHFIIYDLESGFSLFYYEKKLKEIIHTTKDFSRFRKIDNALWRDWDPLDLNSRWVRSEYLSYIPEIFNLVKSKEYTEIIAHHLYNLEINYFNILQPSFDKLKKLASNMKS